VAVRPGAAYWSGRRTEARAAVRLFGELYGAKWPKATAEITGDVEELLAFCGYPAGH
jgi:putative transposase